MDTPQIAHGGGSKHDDTHAGLAAYWHLTITEWMFHGMFNSVNHVE